MTPASSREPELAPAVEGHCQSALVACIDIVHPIGSLPHRRARGAKAFIPKSCWQTTFASSRSQIVADCAPLAIMEDLDATFIICSDQAKGRSAVGAGVAVGVRRTAAGRRGRCRNRRSVPEAAARHTGARREILASVTALTSMFTRRQTLSS